MPSSYAPPVAEGPDGIQAELERAREISEESEVRLLAEIADREYARGVKNALMWVMGETELSPMSPDEDDMPDYGEGVVL